MRPFHEWVRDMTERLSRTTEDSNVAPVAPREATEQPRVFENDQHLVLDDDGCQSWPSFGKAVHKDLQQKPISRYCGLDGREMQRAGARQEFGILYQQWYCTVCGRFERHRYTDGE